MSGLEATLRDSTGADPRAALARLAASADARALAGLGLLFAALTALTWRRWGVPVIDAGHELTAAELVSRGEMAYRDVRYFYGPAGLYALAAALKLFGVSFTTAYAFGLAQAAAIGLAFYALARRMLDVLPAALATAVLLAIGFSGTAFNFVLPHTNSATFGILFLLLMLLALSHERLVPAGLAAGVVCLTRPEFAAVAAFTCAAFLVGHARDHGFGAALRAAPRLALPALAIAVPVLAAFSAGAGASVVFTENLWPVDFLRVTKFGSQTDWAPLDLASLVSTLARAGVYCALLAGAVAAAESVRKRTGAARAAGLWPFAAAGAGVLGGLALWRASGVLPEKQAAVWDETTHLLIGMSWLPALGFAAAGYAGFRLVRGSAPPFSRSWAFDLALVAASVALGARAYDAFTAEGSYAPYYAAPLVLLLALLHERLGERRPDAGPVPVLALGAVAAGLALFALVGLYRDQDTRVHTPRGTVKIDSRGARALQPAIDRVLRTTRPGERILVLPADTGLHFMTGRPPALYDVMFIPGLLDSAADERAAIARLRRERVRLAIVGERRFHGYGFARFGVDYNRLLAGEIRRRGPAVAVLGEPGTEASGTTPSRAYRFYRLTGTPRAQDAAR